jgi:serine/threonine-protein kinase
VILFELLTGTQPFEGETSSAIIASIVAEMPRSLREFRPDAPLELEQAIGYALKKDRDTRYQDVAQFAQALLPFAGSTGNTLVGNISHIVRGTLATAPPPPSDYARESSVGLGATAHSKTEVANASSLPVTVNTADTAPSATKATWGRTGATETHSPRTVLLAAIGSAALVGLAGVIGVAWALTRSPGEDVPATAAPEVATGSISAVIPVETAEPTLEEASPEPSSDPPAEASAEEPDEEPGNDEPQEEVAVAPKKATSRTTKSAKRSTKTPTGTKTTKAEPEKAPAKAEPAKTESKPKNESGGTLHMGLK